MNCETSKVTKHTPGPWMIGDGFEMPSGDELPIVAANGSWPACAWPYGDDGGTMPSPEQLANAHLIAAAPDLLAAWEQFLAAANAKETTAAALAGVVAVQKARGETALTGT